MNLTEAAPTFQELLDRAVQCARADDHERAEALLRQAMRLDPESPLPFFLLAANHAELGRTDLAEGAFIASLTRAPAFGLARFQLGLLQLTNGRAAAAVASWEPLLEAKEPSYLKCFVQGFEAILAGRRGDAEQHIRQGIRLNDGQPALNRDMEGVLRRLSASGLGEAPAQTQAASLDDPSANHFLVGAYRRH